MKFLQLSVPTRCLVTDTCNSLDEVTSMVTTMSQSYLTNVGRLNGNSCCQHFVTEAIATHAKEQGQSRPLGRMIKMQTLV